MSRTVVVPVSASFARPRRSHNPDVLFWIAAALSVAVLVACLTLLGRPWGPPAGLRPWSGDLGASANSQHFSDGYSLLHLSFGALIAIVMRRFNPTLGGGRLGLTVVLSAVVWEVMENLPPVVALFNSAGEGGIYRGDSIANSLGDLLFATIGFLGARRLSGWLIAALLVAIELACALLIADGLLWGSLRLAGVA